ncbi:MAG: hypothetical protein ACFFCM_12195 [Promethearchaeota archaeon]
MKIINENYFKMAVFIFIIFLIMLFIPMFWFATNLDHQSKLYSGGLIINVRIFSLRPENFPQLVYIMGLGLLIIGGFLYFISSIYENNKFITIGFLLGLISCITLIIINVYTQFQILQRIEKIPQYFLLNMGTFLSARFDDPSPPIMEAAFLAFILAHYDFINYQTFIYWVFIHIILNTIILMVIIFHAHNNQLIKINKSGLFSKKETDTPFNLPLFLGAIIFIISLIIIFLPSLWLPKHFTMRFPIRRGGDDDGYSYTFNLVEFLGFSYILGLIALINTGICFIIYGTQKYESMRSVGFILGLCSCIFFSVLNIYSVIHVFIKISEITNEFIYNFCLFANLGFDVPPPPEKAFIFAIIATISSYNNYCKNLVLISPHLILSITALLLVIIIYRKTHFLDEW